MGRMGEARGKAGRRRTDTPSDKFMNFMGIWGSCRSAGLRHADILICAVWIFSLARIRLSTLGIILPMVIIYAGDIIRGLEMAGIDAESAARD